MLQKMESQWLHQHPVEMVKKMRIGGVKMMLPSHYHTPSPVGNVSECVEDG